MKRFFKRALPLCIAAAMLSQVNSFGASAIFKDVTSTYSWAQEAIEGLNAAGIVSGFEDGYFRPADTIRKCDFLIMLNKEFSDPDTAYNGALAPDVEEGVYYEGAFRWASAIRIVNPTPEFFPTEAITRQEAFNLIYKCLEENGTIDETNRYASLAGFADAGDVDADKIEAIGTLAKLGIVNGSNGLILPKSTMTRAEMAVVFFGAKNTSDEILKTKGIAVDSSVGFGVDSADSKFTISTTVDTNYLLDGTEGKLSGEKIEVEEQGKSGVILQNGAKLELADSSIEKSGDSVASLNTGISGVNSALVLRKGSTVTVKNTEINTYGKYSNGITAYDGDNSITIEDSSIITRDANSAPVLINDNSSLILKNVTASSKGDGLNCINITGDGGRTEMTGGSIAAYGKGSSAITTGGDLTIADTKITTDDGTGIEILGNTALSVDNVELNVGGTPIKIASRSKNAPDYTTKNTTTIDNTTFADAGANALIDVINVNSDITITNSVLESSMLFRTVLDKSVNSWASGASANITLDHQDAIGDVDAGISTELTLVLENGSYMKSAINSNQNGTVNIELSSPDDKLELTGDCFIGYITNHGDTSFANIIDHGNKIYYDKDDFNNAWLYEEVWPLPNGGTLEPLNP